jgi:hypothetical protein
MLHNKKIDKDPSLHAVFNKMKKDLSAHLNIVQFNKWTAANPSVTSPIMMLQLHIRLQIIGEPFWDKLTRARQDHPEQGKLDYVNRLQEFVINENRAFKEKMEHDAAKKQYLKKMKKKGKMDDGRDNITRKQSVVLEFFNMKRLSQRFSRVNRSNAVYADALYDEEMDMQQGPSKDHPEEDDDRHTNLLYMEISPEGLEEQQRQRARSQDTKSRGNSSSNATPQGSPIQMQRKQPHGAFSDKYEKSKPLEPEEYLPPHKSSKKQQKQHHQPHAAELLEEELESHKRMKQMLDDENEHNINRGPLRRRRSSLLRMKPDLVREKGADKQDSGYKSNKKRSGKQK